MFDLLKLKDHFSHASRVLVLMIVFPLSGMATPCLYRGSDADARVINRSGEISTPFPASLSAQDCNRLRVASGTVAVYSVGPDSVLAARQVSRGPLVLPLAGSVDSAAADSASVLTQIRIVLEGVNRTKNGSSRGAEGDNLVASFPTGRLAQPASDLLVMLGPVPDRNLETFELLVNGKTVGRQSGPLQVIKFPAAFLAAGSRLTWKLGYSGSIYQGSFSVETAETFQAMQQSLLKNAQGNPDELIVKLRVASGLNLEGYSWDARELIRSVLTH